YPQLRARHHQTCTYRALLLDACDHFEKWSVNSHHCAISREVIQGHTSRGKSLFEPFAHLQPLELRGSIVSTHPRNSTFFTIADDLVFDVFRHRSAIECNHRGATGHSLDHHEPEGFGPVNRDQQGKRAAQKFGLFLVADLANVFDEWCIQKWLDDIFVIFAI